MGVGRQSILQSPISIHLAERARCGGNGMVVKPSVISTAQLNPLRDLHMPPIKRVVFPRPYLRRSGVGDLILGRGSHLDAFSAYPFRT